jgi:hypothetical protein
MWFRTIKFGKSLTDSIVEEDPLSKSSPQHHLKLSQLKNYILIFTIIKDSLL